MKTEIRTKMLQKLTSQVVNPHRFQNLYQRLFATPQWQAAQTVAVTMSMDHEIPTQPLINAAQQAGKTVLIPRTFSGRRMRFYPLTNQTKLAKTRFGVIEPTNGKPIPMNQIDLVIVPGVAFCLINHQRIGYGGGFYDRFLADFPGATLALVQKDQLLEIPWETDSFDVPVQQLLVEDVDE
ncbi:5-formyltetrahydrofolate cyclo-ligase [Fructilactobacillus carniphilus]|uniref:5-formyltetrahydrofolate cyclo-ligase n=1 Tax=Fructilactobacillus carniphilus TaxID=2940297 RepID=A0ABY5BXC7_9LACO|nr:5-formyltetrahydrofolate cyclo-ligase [Fructilactobacillus carniphilus]USS91161.1 5-formyltetrahydrofolate cyclo-ligase [Fructilactobacillus carniphilus]